MFFVCELDRSVEVDGICSFFRRAMDEGYSFEGEFHDFYEVVCVIDGEVGITSETDVFRLIAGQSIIHSPLEFHSIKPLSKHSKIVVFSFSGNISEELYGKIFSTDFYSLNDLSEQAFKIFEYDDIYIKGIKQGYENEALYFTNCIEAFVSRLIKSPFTETSGSYYSSRYTSILSVLNENVDKCLKLEDIADMCNMSVSSLKKNFSQYSNMGVMSYFSSIKMKKAVSLLRRGMSVKETAFALGYVDTNYFSYAFKHIMGRPPSEYKS